jgi:type II secretory pathway component PulJ
VSDFFSVDRTSDRASKYRIFGTSSRANPNRRGVVLIAVLVCLGVIAAIMFSAMQTSLRHRRQMARELQMEQTRWLAEAGMNQAVSAIESKDEARVLRLADGKSYQPEIAGYEPASVSVSAKRSSSGDAVIVEVVASIGDLDRPELVTRHELRSKFQFETKVNDGQEKE